MIEAVIGVPAFMLFVLLIICGGRFAIARPGRRGGGRRRRPGRLDRPHPGPGRSRDGTCRRRRAALSDQGLRCASQQVRRGHAGFGAPVGTPATVTATVDLCRRPVATWRCPACPASRTITATMSSPIDTYRER